MTHDQGKIFFITQPQTYDIEDQKTLFLPYTIDANSLSSFTKEDVSAKADGGFLPQNIQ